MIKRKKESRSLAPLGLLCPSASEALMSATLGYRTESAPLSAAIQTMHGLGALCQGGRKTRVPEKNPWSQIEIDKSYTEGGKPDYPETNPRSLIETDKSHLTSRAWGVNPRSQRWEA